MKKQQEGRKKLGKNILNFTQFEVSLGWELIYKEISWDHSTIIKL